VWGFKGGTEVISFGPDIESEEALLVGVLVAVQILADLALAGDRRAEFWLCTLAQVVAVDLQELRH